MTDRQMILRLMARTAGTAATAASARHRRDADAPDADLHVGAIVVEELSGTINGSNRVFSSTYTPAGGGTFASLLFIRGLAHVTGSGFQRAGRTWWLDEAPETGYMTDQRPIAVYMRDPRAPEYGLDPATMGRRREVPRWDEEWTVQERRRA